MNKLIATIAVLAVAVLAMPARAQVSTNPNNTIVRFDVNTEGTTFGTIDLELFDQEKPETVKNFLLYVYSGVYSNLMIHRAVSNFVIQAGNVRLKDPKSTAAFTSFIPGRDYGEITNEYSVGATLSNVFGTIAMARAGGQTNSASADWFINLKDNTDLDTVDGGFTVFGRVINTTGPATGTNVLNYFRGISNIAPFTVTFDPFNFFSELPYSAPRYVYSTNVTTNVTTVTTNLALQIRDYFTVNASIIRGAARDRFKPKVTLQHPTPRDRVTTNSTLTISGTAKDNMEVARILVNSPTKIIASGAETWAQELTLTPGTNVISVTSLDRFGNESRPQTRRIFYHVPKAIALTNSGAGSIVGITNGQMLDIGRNYTVTAKPDKGNFFASWAGSRVSPFMKLTFMMSEGFNLTALFSTNYFPALRGTYEGLITTATGSPRSAGRITLRLNANGSYTGKLQPLTGNYPIHGQFAFTHDSTITGARGTNSLWLYMHLYTNGVPRIEGAYSDNRESGRVVMYRSEQQDIADIPAGPFTFTISPSTNSAVGDGFGLGTANLDAAGNITIAGSLQNGASIDHGARLVAGSHFPMFLRWSPREAFLGWMEFDTNHSGFFGTAQWVTESSTNEVEMGLVTGSRYTAPEAGQSPLGWTTGTVTLSGDDLASPIDIGATFNGTTLNAAPNTIELHFDPVTTDGRIAGSFVHPVTGLATPIQAALLQNSNMAAGYFLSTNRNGAVRIRQ